MKMKQVTFGIGLVGFLTAFCAVRYYQNMPVILTSAQEMVIAGSGVEFLDTDCQAGIGGCLPNGARPALIPCPDGVAFGQDCGQPRWSVDATLNRVCSTDGDWGWLPGMACSYIAPHNCIEKFTTCGSNSCTQTDEVPGATTATRCQW